MCGIAGIVNLQGIETLQARHIHAMQNRMIHRGPDDEGYVLVDYNGDCLSRLGDDTPGNNQNSSVPAYPNEHIRNAYGTPSVVALGHRRLSIVDLSPHGHQPMCTPDRRYWVVFNGEIYNFQEIARALAKEGVHFHGRSDTETLINAYAVWGERCLENLTACLLLLFGITGKRFYSAPGTELGLNLSITRFRTASLFLPRISKR